MHQHIYSEVKSQPQFLLLDDTNRCSMFDNKTNCQITAAFSKVIQSTISASYQCEHHQSNNTLINFVICRYQAVTSVLLIA